MKIQDQPRRPNLATIVGSSLAVVAAGSLLAFSSLAEQAGLDGLAAGGLQPMHPGRSGGEAHAITVRAPSTAPPGDPRDAFTTLVNDTLARRAPDDAPAPRVAFAPPPRDRSVDVDRSKAAPQPNGPDRVQRRVRAAVAGPDVAKSDEPDGPPYGHAYGYHKKAGEKAKPAQRKGSDERAPKKHTRNKHSDDAPVYARKANDDASSGKPPKVKKVEKVQKVKAPKAKARGHSNHSNGNGNGNGKGHAKHGKGKGKGKAKGHSKHGG